MAVTSKDLRSPARSTSGRPIIAAPRVSFNTAAYVVTILLALLAIYAIMGNVLSWGQTRLDDLRFTETRTYHAVAVVGHEDGPASPSRFVAMNLDRQVVVIEFPGGDTSKARVINGPYLVGANEDRTPVTLAFQDVNSDSAPDMIVNVKNEAIIYVNRDGQFHAITAEERARLLQGTP